MKVKLSILKRIGLTSIFSIIIFGLFGQTDKIDKKIGEIESFKKYKITQVDNKEELEILSDSVTEVTGISYSVRKNKKNLSGKMTVDSKTDVEEIKRIFYFDESSGLFAIVDSIKRRDNKIEKRIYYFDEKRQLYSVVDQNGNDITSTLDSKRFSYSIKLMFTKLFQQKYFLK